MSVEQKCPECGEGVELVEEGNVNPLTGDAADRYKCPCGHTTVRDFSTGT